MENITFKMEKLRHREIEEVRDLLNALLTEGLPEGFDPDGLAIEFNPRSGEVFLVNDYYQIAAMNGDSLELYYILPHSGEEGFKDELAELDLNELHCGDVEYLKDNVI